LDQAAQFKQTAQTAVQSVLREQAAAGQVVAQSLFCIKKRSPTADQLPQLVAQVVQRRQLVEMVELVEHTLLN
jgi:hypothetical protein